MFSFFLPPPHFVGYHFLFCYFTHRIVGVSLRAALFNTAGFVCQSCGLFLYFYHMIVVMISYDLSDILQNHRPS